VGSLVEALVEARLEAAGQAVPREGGVLGGKGKSACVGGRHDLGGLRKGVALRLLPQGPEEVRELSVEAVPLDDLVEWPTTRRMDQLDRDHAAVLIEIDEGTAVDFFGAGDQPVTDVNVERVSFLVVVIAQHLLIRPRGRDYKVMIGRWYAYLKALGACGEAPEPNRTRLARGGFARTPLQCSLDVLLGDPALGHLLLRVVGETGHTSYASGAWPGGGTTRSGIDLTWLSLMRISKE
jgi:hypothetical protein